VIDASQYIYVDTAAGGVDRRNIVKKFDEVRLNGLSDCHTSHNRATEDLVKWLQTHENSRGNPTVAGFDGATWADNLHLDIDAEGNLGLALQRLHAVLDRLETWGVDLSSIRIYFSGAKGFHIEIPHTLFGDFIPSKELPKRLRRAAKRIFGDIPFDTSVYDALRLWRLENSRNAKSRLFKIRLTVGEARTSSIDEITALAAQPRDTSTVPEFEAVPDDEWHPVEELVDIWAATIIDDEPTDRAEQRAPTDAARDAQTSAAITASWPYGGEITTEGDKPNAQVSRHADYLLPVIGYLAPRTSADHVQEIVEDAAERANDQTFLRGRDWRNEIKRIADGAAERIEKDERVRGLPTLGKHFPGLARVLAALWPDPTIIQNLPLGEGDALEEKALLEAASIKRSTGQRVLREALDEGRAVRIGRGKKNDPYRYWAGSNFHSAQATSPWAESNTEPAYTCAVCGILTDSADLCVSCEMEAAS